MRNKVPKIKSRRGPVEIEVAELRFKHDRKVPRGKMKPSNPPPASVNGLRYHVLGGLCAQRRKQEGLSLRDVAQATGLSAATLNRMEHGRNANTENVIALSRWLNVPIQTVTKTTPEDVPNAIKAILMADPKLKTEQQMEFCQIVGVLYRLMTNGK